MISLGLALLAVAIRAGSVPLSDDAEAGYRCGTKALYMLLVVEGRHADLAGLAADLGEPALVDHSLLDLRRAARRHGLRLEGASLEASPNHPAPDRPMLALLDRQPHGHFVVVRPVGHTGTLVQVLDPNGDEPKVMDAARLYEHPEWTGTALIPDRSDWTVRIAVALIATGALAAVFARHVPIALAPPWLRSRRQPQ